MRCTPCCIGDLHVDARDSRATERDGVVGVGPEGYAEHYYPSSDRIAGWEEADPRESQREGHTQTDMSVSQEPKTLQPKAHGTKRSASSPLPHGPEIKKTNTGPGNNDNCGNEISTGDEVGSDPRARIETPSRPASINGQSATKTTASKPTDDDSEPEITAERPSPALKRKASVTSVSDSAKKRAKHTETIDISDEEDETEVRGTKGKAPKQKSTPVVSTTSSKTARVQLNGSEVEGSESSEDDDDADEEQAAAAAAAAEEEASFRREIAKADKEFDSTCRSCKTNANKALRSKYDLRISKIKSDHKYELKKQKDTAAKTLTETKNKSDKEKKDTKLKHEDDIKNIKTRHDTKIATMRSSHEAALERLQERYNKEKAKAAGLARELEEANTKRKDVEKSSNQKVKEATADLIAGGKQLEEQKKQILREKKEEISHLKPEHSKVVKEKDVEIKEMTQKVSQLEKELKTNERHLFDVREEAAAEKQRHSNCKAELAQAKRHIAEVEKDVKKCKAYAEKTEHRTETDKVRAKEKIELAIANRNQQNERLILSQRENYQLKDQVRKLALRGREIRDELETLKVELKSTKAELGVARDMEGMENSLDQEAAAQMASMSDDRIIVD
jgi:hypothetical protein